MEFVPASQLYAIQLIKGETRTEKFKEIGRIVKLVKKLSDLEKVLEVECVPKALVPLIKIYVGVRLKSPACVTEALKSNDSNVIVPALRAKWYFNGSIKSITNFSHFSKKILPFVSVRTRREIVKRLAVGLAKNNEALAEEFFNGFTSWYGVQEAVRLLPICKKDFAYEAIIKHKLLLSNKLLKQIYFKYPDLGLQYLKLTSPYEKKGELERPMYRLIQVLEYQNFMPYLIKKHAKEFVDLQAVNHNSGALSNSRAKILLRKAKEVLIQKPRELMNLLPNLRVIYETLTKEEFETLIGNLMERRWDLFNVDEIIGFLHYYPKEERANLIRKKVKEKYSHDIYEKIEKLTCKFLLLLPKEDRYLLAKRILDSRDKIEITNKEVSWWCFLPATDAIHALKKQIENCWKTDKRKRLFSQMIYVCKLNQDKEALFEVLEFVEKNHKKENTEIVCKLLDGVAEEFDIYGFDAKFYRVLFNIIKRIKLRPSLAKSYWVVIKMLKAAARCYEKNNLPSDEIIEKIAQLFEEGRVGNSWALLHDQMELERKYLDTTLNHEYWLDMNYQKNVIAGIYDFNERHKLENSNRKLSIKDYPELLTAVEDKLTLEEKGAIWVDTAKNFLRKHEPELYQFWFPKESSDSEEYSESGTSEHGTCTPEVREKKIFITQAIIALKRNYPEIKNNWVQYYELCKKEINSKKRHWVKHFLKTLRWYQDVPIEFAKLSILDKHFSIMSFLFEGETFYKIAVPFLPKEEEKSHKISCMHALHITAAARNTTPSIPTDLVEKYLNARCMYTYNTYINDGLNMWSYLAYRTPMDQLVALSMSFGDVRLSIKKHSIRVLDWLASRNDLVTFYGTLWQSENHPFIRKMLADRIVGLFSKRPSTDTWELISICIASVTFSEGDILFDLIGTKAIPSEFVSFYGELILQKINEFISEGMPNHRAVNYLVGFFENVRLESRDELSEDFYKRSLRFYIDNFSELNNGDQFIARVYLSPSSEHFEERMQHMAQVLIEESEKWYSLSVVERAKSSPNFVDSFVQTIANEVQKSKGNSKLVERMCDIYSKNFPPHRHASSQIMLFLCSEFMRADQSFKDFGIQLSISVDSLIEIYTMGFFFHIVDVIKDFIGNFISYEYIMTIKNRISFLEGLIENKNVHGLMIAAKLVKQKLIEEFDTGFCRILEQLSEADNIMVQALLQ